MKLPKWLYCLILGLVSVLTTSCSDSKEDEPTLPTLSESAWVLYQIDEWSSYNNQTTTEYVEEAEVLVFNKNNRATLYTNEDDFEPIEYHYQTDGQNIRMVLLDYLNDPEEDDVPAEEDSENVIGTWNITNNCLILDYGWKDEYGEWEERSKCYYKHIPYGEAQDYVKRFRDKWLNSYDK